MMARVFPLGPKPYADPGWVLCKSLVMDVQSLPSCKESISQAITSADPLKKMPGFCQSVPWKIAKAQINTHFPAMGTVPEKATCRTGGNLA